MRKAIFLTLSILALAACQREADFDERYEAARESVHSTAAEIDAQIENSPTASPEEAAP